MINYIDLLNQGFNKGQIDQIKEAIDSNIDINYINKFAKKEYDAHKMFLIVRSLKESNEILNYINPNMDIKLLRKICGLISANNNSIIGNKLTKEELNDKINLLIIES